MPPGPTPPRGPYGLAAIPRSWIRVPTASSGAPRWGLTRKSLMPSIGIVSLDSRGLPSLASTRGLAAGGRVVEGAARGVGEPAFGGGGSAIGFRVGAATEFTG